MKAQDDLIHELFFSESLAKGSMSLEVGDAGGTRADAIPLREFDPVGSPEGLRWRLHRAPNRGPVVAAQTNDQL